MSTQSMIVLSYGITKSGSTLAFELCKAILEVRGFKQRRLPDAVVRANHLVNFISDPTPAQLEAMQAALAPGERIVVKLHGPLSTEARSCLDADAQGRFRVHINYRDPREVCLSLLDSAASIRQRDPNPVRGFGMLRTLDDAARFTAAQLQDLKTWAAVNHALYLYYNDVAFSTDAVMDRLCVDLGLATLDAGERASIQHMVFNQTHTLRNKAVMDRHQTDLDEAGRQLLLDTIPGLATFIERACQQRDYVWLQSA